MSGVASGVWSGEGDGSQWEGGRSEKGSGFELNRDYKPLLAAKLFVVEDAVLTQRMPPTRNTSTGKHK